MKTVFTHRCKLALLLSATLSLNAWSADVVQASPAKSESIELTNLGPENAVENTASPNADAAELQGDGKNTADAAPSETAEAKKSRPLPRKEGEGTSFADVGLPGTVTAENFEQHGSPANYRETILNKAMVNRNQNPVALRRYLAVDRATYQARIGQ